MRQNIYSILIAGAAITALSGCEKEAAFNMNPGEGQLNCNALNVDYISRGKPVRSSEVELGDFVVDFVNIDTKETARSFKYSQMPEIVSLPEGKYLAEAIYGDNPVAAWESPYYSGNSEFSITAGEITDDVNDVECVLSNIRVRVDVNDSGLGLVGDDVQVVVSAGNEGKLIFDQTTNDKAGYFRYIENSSTLVADFSGTVDGVFIDPTAFIFNNVEAGNSYEININVNSPDNVEPGYVVIGGEPGNEITLNATITIIPETIHVDPNEPDADILVDDMRPAGDPGNGDDPNNGDNPQPDTPGPKIIPTAPGLKLGECYIITGSEATPVSFKVTSATGITEFKIIIDSDKLTPSELQGVGLTEDLDLVNTGSLEEALNGLGFKTGNDVKGQNECSFDISGFVPMLMMLGPGEHKFYITVSDAEGTAEAMLWLKNN
ncbi:MAG: DUF4493 domain-containing protein [Muribaculaceae bacterium]|nr:DUF4493 domain-containing protein [Muribaculaceae bacterium]